MQTSADVVEMLLTAPAGVALLQSLEVECRSDVSWWESPGDSNPSAVETAVALVGELSFGGLVQRAVAAAYRIDGPWMPSAPSDLTNAYSVAPAHATIAATIAERFARSLSAAIDVGVQEWWSSGPHDVPAPTTAWDLSQVYCCGEFTWEGLWTVTSPPAAVHHDLIDHWEIYPRPVGRWRLPVRPGVRVYEIHDVTDWARLVASYPLRPAIRHSGWELPGPNQHLAEIVGVEIASGGRAARSAVAVAMPDWERVAADYDGVHLSWMGMLAAEGHVVEVPELGNGTVTMLRYWMSERTLWLRDVFGEPEPGPAPQIIGDDGEVDGENAIDVACHPDREAADREVLRRRLGRDPV